MSSNSNAVSTKEDRTEREARQQFEKDVEKMINIIKDESPLPPTFPYDYFLEAHLWRTATLTAFTLGIRLGGFSMISDLINIIPSILLFALIYIGFPVGMVYGHTQVDKNTVNDSERKIILMGCGFVTGLLSGAFNINYVIIDNAPPSYFLPAVVAVVIYFGGPQLGQNRRHLLAASIGTATALGYALAIALGDFSLGLIFFFIIAAVLTAINVQFTLAELKQGTADMIMTNIKALIIANYQHLIVSRLLGAYRPDSGEKSQPSITKAIIN